MVLLAWHYTTGGNFIDIMTSGILMTTSENCPTHERPVLWFSLNPNWEPTAVKGIVENGRRRTATMQETKKLGGGLVRLGYPHSELIPWPKLAKEAGILSRNRKMLEKTGMEQGANPHHWCGSLFPISLDELVVEFMNEQWGRVLSTTQKDAA